MRSRWKAGVFTLLLVVGCSRSGGSGPPQSLHAFASSETPITTQRVTPAEGGWRVASDGAGSVRLFEVPTAGL